jgi:hypothetical protein
MLLPSSVLYGNATLSASPTGCSEFDELIACAWGDGSLLQVRIVNKTRGTLEIRWSESVLIDDEGYARELVKFPDPHSGPERVAPGRESFAQKLVPSDKVSMVTVAGRSAPSITPWIPWNSQACPSRQSADRFFAERRTMAVEVPVLTPRSTEMIRFELELQPISRDDFQNRLAEKGGY